MLFGRTHLPYQKAISGTSFINVGSVGKPKAAWAVDDLEQDIGLVHRSLGRRGLQSISDIGPGVAQVIEGRLAAEG